MTTFPNNAVMFDDSYSGMIPPAIDPNLLDLELSDIREERRQELQTDLALSIKQAIDSTPDEVH